MTGHEVIQFVEIMCSETECANCPFYTQPPTCTSVYMAVNMPDKEKRVALAFAMVSEAKKDKMIANGALKYVGTEVL